MSQETVAIFELVLNLLTYTKHNRMSHFTKQDNIHISKSIAWFKGTVFWIKL